MPEKPSEQALRNAFSHTGANALASQNPEREDTVEPALHNDYFGMHTLDDGDVVSYQLPHGEWIRHFRANGLDSSTRGPGRTPSPPTGATKSGWARRSPSESIRKAP